MNTTMNFESRSDSVEKDGSMIMVLVVFIFFMFMMLRFDFCGFFVSPPGPCCSTIGRENAQILKNRRFFGITNDRRTMESFSMRLYFFSDIIPPFITGFLNPTSGVENLHCTGDDKTPQGQLKRRGESLQTY